MTTGTSTMPSLPPMYLPLGAMFLARPELLLSRHVSHRSTSHCAKHKTRFHCVRKTRDGATEISLRAGLGDISISQRWCDGRLANGWDCLACSKRCRRRKLDATLYLSDNHLKPDFLFSYSQRRSCLKSLYSRVSDAEVINSVIFDLNDSWGS